MAWGSRVGMGGGRGRFIGQNMSSARFRRHRCSEAVQWAWVNGVMATQATCSGVDVAMV